MPKETLFGSAHRQILSELSAEWWQQGPPVCFLEGFPGVGKSNAILPRLRGRIHATKGRTIVVAVPAPGYTQKDDLLLDLAQEMALQGFREMAAAIDTGLDSAAVVALFERAMQSSVLVVWDEFQNALDRDTGEVAPVFRNLFERLARRHNWPGRLLLLSNRLIYRGSWGGAHRFIPIPSLDSDGGLALLGDLLRRTGREGEVPMARRLDVVAWLGGNPRALRLLVAALASHSLEELVGHRPQAWELRDRAVSPSLVQDLERQLVSKVLGHLSAPEREVLDLVSVYRKPFKGELFGQLAANNTETGQVRRKLSDLFLLEQRQGWCSLNPVAREVVARAAEGDPELWHRAHRIAGEWYARHFRAKQIASGGHMGGYFVEARYHFVQAGRGEELKAIARCFAPHVHSEIRTGSLPRDERGLDEHIAVLTSLLNDGAVVDGLEYQLARCLVLRRRDDDARQALDHLRGSTMSPASADAWLLRLRLEDEFAGTDAVLYAAREAVALVPSERGAVSIYQNAGEILVKNGRVADALTLLREGISKVSPEDGVSSLYHAAGEILSKNDHVEEALTLLSEGISKISPEQSVFSLYHKAGEVDPIFWTRSIFAF